jgi:hypothetical protein
MPGQLDQLDYRKNPNAPIGASGTVQDRYFPIKDKDIKKASATRATESETGIDSNTLDTFRAKGGKLLDFLIKNKSKYTKEQSLKDTITPLVGIISRLNRYKDIIVQDPNSPQGVKKIPITDDKKKIVIIETGKEYKLEEAAKIIVDIIKSYEKKFDLKLWENKDPQWKELAKRGITKDMIGFYSIALDVLCPIAKIPRKLTRGQTEAKRYILALDKNSDIKNNVWVIWRKLDKKEPTSIDELASKKYLRSRLGDLDYKSTWAQRGKGTSLQRENEEGNLPLKFIGLDENGYPQFGDQLTFDEVKSTSTAELLELTGHYEIIKVIEGWEDEDPKYAQYDIQRFIARGATQTPRARALKMKKTEPTGFFR